MSGREKCVVSGLEALSALQCIYSAIIQKQIISIPISEKAQITGETDGSSMMATGTGTWGRDNFCPNNSRNCGNCDSRSLVVLFREREPQRRTFDQMTTVVQIAATPRYIRERTTKTF